MLLNPLKPRFLSISLCRYQSDRLVDFGSYNYYGRGIGLTYFDASSISPNTRSLFYFKKGAETCGTPISFPTSIKTPSVFNPKIKFFPNPTQDILNIETDLSFFDIKISNFNGQIVLKSQNTSAPEKLFSSAAGSTSTLSTTAS